MIAFIDIDGQVMAYYTHDTNSTAWAAFTKITVDPTHEQDIRRHGRDCRITPAGVVPNPNPIQPQPKPDTPEQARFKELRGKLLADLITDAEVRELLKLQFTPGAAQPPETRR